MSTSIRFAQQALAVKGLPSSRRLPLGLASGIIAFACALTFNGPGQNFIVFTPAIGLLLLWGASLIVSDARRGIFRLPSSGFAYLLAGWLTWMLLSPWWSQWFQISWIYALTIGATPLSFLVWLYQPDAERNWPKLFHWLLFATGLAALWGVLEYFGTHYRSNGPFLDYNAFGALMSVFFFPTLFRYFESWSSEKPAFWRQRAYEFALLLLAMSLFATYSRGAIAPWLILLGVSFWLARPRFRHFWHSAAISLAIVLCAFSAIKLYPTKPMDRTLALQHDPSTQSRLLMWHSMLEIYAHHPWLGTGLGTYKSEYPAYRSPAEIDSSGDLGHNDYIQFLQEGGPVQLAFFALTGLGVLLIGYRLFRRTRDPTTSTPQARMALGLVLALVALWGQALVNFIFYILPLAVVAGLYLAQAYRAGTTPAFRTFRVRVSGFTVGFVLGVVWLLVVGGLAVDGVAAMVIMGQSNLPFAQHIRQDPHRLYRFAELIAALRPHSTVPRHVLAGSDLGVAEAHPHSPIGTFAAGRALDELVKIIELRPIDSVAHTGLARLLLAYPQLAKYVPGPISHDPRQLLREAIHNDPEDTTSYSLLAEQYENANQPKRAYALLAHQAPLWLRIPAPERVKREKLMQSALGLALQLNKQKDIPPLARIVSQLGRNIRPSAKDIKTLTGRSVNLASSVAADY